MKTADCADRLRTILNFFFGAAVWHQAVRSLSGTDEQWRRGTTHTTTQDRIERSEAGRRPDVSSSQFRHRFTTTHERTKKSSQPLGICAV